MEEDNTGIGGVVIFLHGVNISRTQTWHGQKG